MFDQTFSLVDIPLLFVLIGLEILLSADNAIAISLIAHRLPKTHRTKALWTGFSSAFIYRGLIILGASFLIEWTWVKILGALYLIFLAIKCFFTKSCKVEIKTTPAAFWKAICFIELTDLIFALDSIIAAIGVIGIPAHYKGLYPKLWIVYLGGLTGASIIRFSVSWVTKLIDQFPRLSLSAHMLIGWVGIKLIGETLLISFTMSYHWIAWIFWPFLLIILGWGFTKTSKKTPK